MTKESPPKGDTLPTSRSLVSIVGAKSARELHSIIARKPDNRMSDESWVKLHQVGELAVEKLEALINDPAFEKRPLSERIKIIELAMSRAFGSPETGAKRGYVAGGAKYKAPLDGRAMGNTLSRLAKTAAYPELKSSRVDRTDE